MQVLTFPERGRKKIPNTICSTGINMYPFKRIYWIRIFLSNLPCLPPLFYWNFSISPSSPLTEVKENVISLYESRKGKSPRFTLKEFWKIKTKVLEQLTIDEYRWDKVFKNGPSKVCERQPWKAAFHKFYLVQCWIFVN